MLYMLANFTKKMGNKLPTTSASDLSEKMYYVIRNEIFFKHMNFKTKQVCMHVDVRT